jgi:hypothetical protein
MTDQAQSTPEVEAGREEGLLELAAGVVVEPSATLRSVTKAAPIGQAILLTVLISLLTSLASAAEVGLGDGEADALFRQLDLSRSALMIGMVLFSPLASLAVLAIGAGIFKLSSLMLGGKGPYAGLFSGLAFANVPSVFGVPVALLPLALGAAGRVVAGVANIGLGIWVLVLAVIAVRENNGFTTGRAVAAVLVPILFIFLIFVVLMVVLVIAVMEGVGGQL